MEIDRQAMVQLQERVVQAIREGGVAPAALMAQLAVIRYDIDMALSEARMRKSTLSRNIEDLRKSVVEAVGGWTALGKNNEEREYALRIALGRSEAYGQASQELARVEFEIDRLQAARDFIDNLISSLRGAIRAYLAQSLNVSGRGEDIL